MTLRRIDSYATDDPEKLQDQLSRLEDNIQTALDDTGERLEFGDWVSSDAAVIQLTYGKIARVDTSISALRVALPSVSAATISREVGIKVSGANVATISPVESTALIDGASSVALAGGALYRYIHDGSTWSRL